MQGIENVILLALLCSYSCAFSWRLVAIYTNNMIKNKTKRTVPVLACAQDHQMWRWT